MLKSSTEDFINKAIKVHNKYDYSKVDYINWITKVVIICPLHGEFEQSPNGHLSGRGCKLCKSEHISKCRKTDYKQFIKKAKEVHGDLYDYSKVDFNDVDTDVVVICKTHGDIKIKPKVHLRAMGCHFCGKEAKIKNISKDNKYIISELEKIFGDTYIYENIEYKHSGEKIKVICKEHGEFYKLFSNLVKGSGCPKCGNSKKGIVHSITTKDFIEKATITHGNKYDYSETTYTKRKDKVEIICKKHGKFTQNAGNHLAGNNCPKCSEEGMRDTSVGWSYTDWEIGGEKSKFFDSFKVYIIRCWNEEEEFFKIGKTFNTIPYRFNSINKMPYSYEVIKMYKGEAKEMSELEQKLKKDNNVNKYTPKIYFSGMQECFNNFIEI